MCISKTLSLFIFLTLISPKERGQWQVLEMPLISFESLESNVVEILPNDTFAPTAPTSITIAAVPGNISIFFASNPEKDIAGYSIYRSTDENSDQTDWSLLNPDLLTTNTFQDTKIESGTKYFYYIKAIDLRGNVSEPRGARTRWKTP